MKQKKLYQILPFVIIGICVAGTCMVGTRIFAKKVLIGKLGIENYVTCMLADYNWGDRMERRVPEETAKQTAPERLGELEQILAEAPASADAKAPEEVSEDLKQTGLLSEIAEKWDRKVTTAEDDITKYCNDKFMLYRQLREISSGFDRVMGWNLAYARKTGTTYTLNTGYDYQAVETMDMAEYAGRVIAERDAAEAAGAEFLYVQYPYRVDEENSQVPWGASACENENADQMLGMLSDASVDTVDLRKALTDRGWEYDSGFYETDGHWTTRSGFYSAGILADYLNENYGFSYHNSYFDESSYDVRRYSANSYMVKEEVELFLPDFETEFCVIDAYRDAFYEGSFAESCFDMTKADTKEYSSVLTAYSASRIRNSYLFEYQNRGQVGNEKRILVCSDSFSWHLIPYLALDTRYVDYVYKITPEQMAYYVEKLQPDMVIVLDRP